MDRTTQARATLSRIADALGQPQDTFYDGSTTADIAGLIELVRLWDELTYDGARAQVLALARSLAAAGEGRDQASQ